MLWLVEVLESLVFELEHWFWCGLTGVVKNYGSKPDCYSVLRATAASS